MVDTIIRTQNPDWSDLQVILDNLLDDTEKQMVLKAGKAQAEVAVKSRIFRLGTRSGIQILWNTEKD